MDVTLSERVWAENWYTEDRYGDAYTCMANERCGIEMLAKCKRRGRGL